MFQSNDVFIINLITISIAIASIIIAILTYKYTKKQNRINYLLKQLEDFYSPLYENLRRFFRSKRDDKQLLHLYKKLSDIRLKYGHLCDLDFFGIYNMLMIELSFHPDIIENWREIKDEIDFDDRIEIHRKETIELASSVIDEIRKINRKKMQEIFKLTGTKEQFSEYERQQNELSEKKIEYDGVY